MVNSGIEILREKTYIKAIENSEGSKIFNSLFVRDKTSDETRDILNDGEYSCAFFVSSILFLFQMLDRNVTTVATLKKLVTENPNWSRVELDHIKPGDLVFWDKIKYEDGSENAHVGFILNAKEAISTDYKKKAISRHPIGSRVVTDIFRYS